MWPYNCYQAWYRWLYIYNDIPLLPIFWSTLSTLSSPLHSLLVMIPSIHPILFFIMFLFLFLHHLQSSLFLLHSNIPVPYSYPPLILCVLLLLLHRHCVCYGQCLGDGHYRGKIWSNKMKRDKIESKARDLIEEMEGIFDMTRLNCLTCQSLLHHYLLLTVTALILHFILF